MSSPVWRRRRRNVRARIARRHDERFEALFGGRMTSSQALEELESALVSKIHEATEQYSALWAHVPKRVMLGLPAASIEAMIEPHFEAMPQRVMLGWPAGESEAAPRGE